MAVLWHRRTGHRSEKPYLGRLYPGPGFFGHHPQLVTVDEDRDIYDAELCLATRSGPAYHRLPEDPSRMSFRVRNPSGGNPHWSCPSFSSDTDLHLFPGPWHRLFRGCLAR
ncbi:UNVERIFIED_CONTAM: hypothetical protein PYX00_007125 [Menopon gallinae]|uniref:Uncharacterized protein n=1 Tax=Menopon gallinae TaxID=328185 RepID=A0AAW2HHX0_9NEOP